ncbi:hypothetical protein L6Q21_03920 [Sandaracinobacter sp. RS1-74]|uniref:hypothetical protein n=1 Tax=Sandaracinobacteroides sayramensis TaxID=2913411 RepID=UPI001EDA3B8A|nr:hypothetical protein [Sandaracinobacteroides sayramensis]MCG2840132.1 hypothetical protein [Sandaracinobacteroides sayramensis]
MKSFVRKFTSTFAVLAMMGYAVAASSVAHAGTYTGAVTVSKGLTFTCDATVDLYSTPGKALLTISPGDPLCSFLNITSNPHNYTESGGVLTIHGIRVETITLGNCYGDLSGTVTTNPDGSKTLNIADTIDPEIPGTGGCSVNGELWKPAH